MNYCGGLLERFVGRKEGKRNNRRRRGRKEERRKEGWKGGGRGKQEGEKRRGRSKDRLAKTKGAGKWGEKQRSQGKRGKVDKGKKNPSSLPRISTKRMKMKRIHFFSPSASMKYLSIREHRKQPPSLRSLLAVLSWQGWILAVLRPSDRLRKFCVEDPCVPHASAQGGWQSGQGCLAQGWASLAWADPPPGSKEPVRPALVPASL